MTTKLVYVLTCAPNKTYIEQALMSVYSARYWNPNSQIILITDDETNHLFTGTRGEILNYISEKIVVPFSNDESMMYRSRFIKTQVRELVKGDFLFIDCDTIVCKPLADIDKWDIEVGAVYESHLKVNEFCIALYQSALEPNMKIGVDLSKEEEYFSSGVLYVKDTPNAHRLYDLWHKNWLESQNIGVPIDQPSLCKANIQCDHIIKKIPDTYNTILFTECGFTRKAHILHIAAYRNPSVLFEERTLHYVRKNGLKDEKLKDLILHPCKSFRPFDIDILHSSIIDRLTWTKEVAGLESGYVRAMVWMIRKRIHVLRHRHQIKDNACRK